MNLASRLMIYAKAFPEVIVPMKKNSLQPFEKALPARRLIAHRRIKQDSRSIRFITFRKGYRRQAHTKTLRAPRYRRNPDGTPRIVNVRESVWIPAVGYIGSRKMTIKELEEEAIQKLAEVSVPC